MARPRALHAFINICSIKNISVILACKSDSVKGTIMIGLWPKIRNVKKKTTARVLSMGLALAKNVLSGM
jgi:hypothetical protein